MTAATILANTKTIKTLSVLYTEPAFGVVVADSRRTDKSCNICLKWWLCKSKMICISSAIALYNCIFHRDISPQNMTPCCSSEHLCQEKAEP